MNKKYVKGETAVIVTNRNTQIRITCYYPKENPEGWLEDITNTMAYVGLFDHLKK